jgi:hypothetical protein
MRDEPAGAGGLTITHEDCLAQWGDLWTSAARVAGLDHVQSDESTREPLQLLVGALIYHGKALKAFGNATLHEPVRQNPAVMRDLLSLPGAALSDPTTEKLEVIGGVHLASASLRLPTAILETIEARPTARAPSKTCARTMRMVGSLIEAQKSAPNYSDDQAVAEHCDRSTLNLPSALIILLSSERILATVRKERGARTDGSQNAQQSLPKCIGVGPSRPSGSLSNGIECFEQARS